MTGRTGTVRRDRASCRDAHEILARASDPAEPRRALRHAVLRLRPRRRHAPGRGAPAPRLPPAFDLAYAVKANPNLAVLRHLTGLGLGADVASGGELRHVLRAGLRRRPRRGHGPRQARRGAGGGRRGRRPRRDRRVASASCGGWRGSRRRSGRRQPVLLRRRGRPRRPASSGSGSSATTAPASSGWTPPTCGPPRRRRSRSPWLEPVGHARVRGVERARRRRPSPPTSRRPSRRGARLAATAGFPLRLVDAGGGLGIPYEPHDEPARPRAARRCGSTRWPRGWPPTRRPRDTRILLEPGRFLVGPAGAYVARVVDRKRVGGQHVVILDGGIHHVLRPALVGQEHRVARR